MSAFTLSPTMTAAAAGSPTAASAASKMAGCGFRNPSSADEIAAEKMRSRAKWEANSSRGRCVFEISPIFRPASASLRRTGSTSSYRKK